MDFITISIKGKDNILEKDNYKLFDKPKGRGANDKNNKVRELMIYSIINNLIPEEWYTIEDWIILKTELYKYIHHNCFNQYKNLTCEIKAGRSYNYDFDFKFILNDDSIVYKHIEFKFGCNKVTGCPQFLSLSSNFNTDYSEYFYDNFVPEISKLYNTVNPEKKEYLKLVTTTNYSNHVWFDNLYKNEKEYIKQKKKLVDTSIDKYLNLNYKNFDLNKLTHKFKNTQKNKLYMCYCDKKFVYDYIDENELDIVKINTLKAGRNKLKHTLILGTRTNTTIHMLLRWRNHAGILNPAWQIKLVR